MRAALLLFTSLPLLWEGADDDADGPADVARPPWSSQAELAWAATAPVGAGLGLAWFLFHQLSVRFVGPLVAGCVVVAVGAALTGSRHFRGVAAVAEDLSDQPPGPAAPPAMGSSALAVSLVVLAQVALLQRVNLAPAAIVLVPMTALMAQVLLLGAEDAEGVGVPAPSLASRVGVLVGGALLMVLPILVAPLERPERLNPPIAGMDYPVLGLGMLAVALLSGWVSRAWLRGRFGGLDAAAWHTVGLVSETSALVLVAIRLN